jgi:small-conductance mechanosensitive channel
MMPGKLGPILALLGWSLTSTAVCLSQTQERAGTIEVRSAEPAALSVWNRPVAVLRAEIAGVSPRERAEGARRRIEELPLEEVEIRAEPASVRGLEGIAVFGGSRMLFGLVKQDLDAESSESLEDAASAALSQLEEILSARAEAHRPRAIMNGLAYTAGSLMLLLVFARGIFRIRRLSERLHPHFLRKARIHGVDMAPVLSYLGRSTVRILSAGIVLFAVYLFVAFALSQFPYTRPWGEDLGRFLVVHLFDLAKSALAAVPGFLTAALLFVAGRLITRAVSGLFDRVEKDQTVVPWLDPDTARATRRIVVVLIWIFVLTAAYPYIPGSRTEAFKAISVFVGLMASLGGVGFVNQVMSGLVVVYSRSLRVGDYVRVGDKEGVVKDVGALATKIVTVEREEVTVPNAVLVGATVTNFSKLAGEEGPIVQTRVTIGYDVAWRQVEVLLELAADRTRGLRKSPKPRVLQRALSDFYVEYQLLAHLERAEDRIPVLSELHAQIQDAFNEFGVQIMSPHFENQPAQKVFVAREGWTPAPAAPPSGSESILGRSGE